MQVKLKISGTFYRNIPSACFQPSFPCILVVDAEGKIHLAGIKQDSTIKEF